MDRKITEQVVWEFGEYLRMEEKSEATISKYVRAVREFGEFLEGEDVDKGKLLEYRRRLAETCRPQTVNGRLSAIHMFLNWLGHSEWRIRFLKVQRQPFLNENRELTEQEYRSLLEAAQADGKERMYHILLTLCGTGIRVSELQYITVEAVRRGRAEISMKGINRVILLPEKLRRKLTEYMEKQEIHSGAVFCTRSGKPVDRSNICHEMKKLCEKAGVSRCKVFPHNLRHLFARKFYEITKDLSHLADLLGHSSIETTRIYTATSFQEQKRFLDQMELIL